MNKDLYSSAQGEIQFPKRLRDHMKRSHERVIDAIDDLDKSIEGYKRNQELQDKEFIDYKQLKRIKNFFDNFKGSHKHPSFVLNGGFEMKNWVNNELRRMREFGKMTKKVKMDTGMQNAFLAPHSKNDFTNLHPSDEHSRPIDKYNQQVTESLRRIKEIISKI